ncbi:MAG TPA: hypothetical protein VJ905_08690 [Halalkalibaculum sp.]|nr:hypothetical protein [Halalkalibaculum sp.]
MRDNTSDVEKVVKLWIGGLALFTAGMAALAIKRTVHGLKKYRRKYNPDSVTDFSGHVVDVYYSKESRHDTRGVILFLADEEDVMEVHLGPSWYIDRQLRHIKIGEELTVTGSVIDYKNQEILVAGTLERGKSKFRFRDEEGSPYWESKVN